jgi:hypothetical protein
MVLKRKLPYAYQDEDPLVDAQYAGQGDRRCIDHDWHVSERKNEKKQGKQLTNELGIESMDEILMETRALHLEENG